MNFGLSDSRGQKSTTLTLVLIPWFILCAKFLVAGVNIPMLGLQPAMGASEFGGGLTLLLVIWLGREGMDKGAINFGGQK